MSSVPTSPFRVDELFHALLEELMTGRLPAVPLIDA